MWNEVPLGAVTVINPMGIGASILSLCTEHELVVNLNLTKKQQLSNYNSRNISGFLFSVPTADLKKINMLKNRCKNLGSFNGSNKITFGYRGDVVGTIPIQLFHELQTPQLQKIPQSPPNKDYFSTNKHVKEPVNMKLVLRKLLKAQKDLIKLKFTPTRQRITPFTAINSSFVLAASDHPYITLQKPRVGSVITIANAARHLVCLGVKPVHMAVAFHCGDLNNNIFVSSM